jgi:hypothetical protein
MLHATLRDDMEGDWEIVFPKPPGPWSPVYDLRTRKKCTGEPRGWTHLYQWESQRECKEFIGDCVDEIEELSSLRVSPPDCYCCIVLEDTEIENEDTFMPVIRTTVLLTILQ